MIDDITKWTEATLPKAEAELKMLQAELNAA